MSIEGSHRGATTTVALGDQVERELSQHKPLSVRRGIVLGLSAQQVGPVLALYVGLVFLTSGATSWVGTLIGGVLILAIAEMIRIFATKYVTSGGLMSYVLHGLGRRWGLLTGAALILGYVAATAAVASVVVVFASSALSDLGFSGAFATNTQVVILLIVGVATGLFACLGVQGVALVALIFSIGVVPFIVALSVGAAANTGVDLPALVNFSHTNLHNIVFGVTLTLGGLVGFDDMATVAAETKNPKRSIPRIIFTVVIVLLVGQLVAIVLQTSSMAANADLLAAGTSPISIVASSAHLPWMGTVLDILLTLGEFAGGVAFVTYGSRIFATAAEIGLLPRFVATISARTKSPNVAIIMLAVLQTILPIILVVAAGTAPIEGGLYFSSAITYFWCVPYVMTAVAAVVVLRRTGSTEVVSWVAVFVASIGFTTFVVFTFVEGLSGIYAAIPFISFIAIAVLFAIFLLLDRRRGGTKIELNRLASGVSQ
ncbi:APC family permease [Pseudofrankia sp. BMG5.36]|uniref:APC family permease n=1 Tax=Pseudofrankia sp. BMG5.36 TaxID=1834512 RepID=UPI0008D8DC6C|nr:APC family permease [Pseudofrankia sp. BMG5.36]OHV73975.1 hypothetical protein BCD48_32770 [Pseudofrankia sp. BMG5.36]